MHSPEAELLALVHREDDLVLVEKRILECFRGDEPNLRRLSVVCIGHFARIHGRVTPELIDALASALSDPSADVRGAATDADDDVDIFLRRRCPTAADFAFEDGELNGPADPMALASLRAAMPALPADYLEFLSRHDGGEGFTPTAYVRLDRAEELVAVNREAKVDEYAPGFFVFGGNGGGEAYAFDLQSTPAPVVLVPWIVLARADAIEQADSFSTFLLGLSYGALLTFDTGAAARTRAAGLFRPPAANELGGE